MKKKFFLLLSAFMLLTFIPAKLNAENDKNPTPAVSARSVDATEVNSDATIAISESSKYDAEITRLEEIKTMDKSELTAAEKKELRNEVHGIQRDMDRHDRDRDRDDHDGGRHHGGGMYFTIGGGLLVILLLILLL